MLEAPSFLVIKTMIAEKVQKINLQNKSKKQCCNSKGKRLLNSLKCVIIITIERCSY